MIVVEPACDADVEGIAEVHVAAWQRAYQGLLPAEVLAAQSVERRTEAWTSQLRDAGVAAWVSRDSRGIINGFVAAGASRDADAEPSTGEVYAVYVHPDAWGSGAGHALVSSASASLADDYEAATLWVLAGNDRACRFYERQGWRPDGSQREEARGAAVVNEARYCASLRPRR